MTIIICCCNNAVNAVVPPELYTNFGIASSSLADMFTATSNVILDDTNIRLNEQSIKFDLLWSAIGRACPPNVFSNDPVNMKLLEKYVRTSGYYDIKNMYTRELSYLFYLQHTDIVIIFNTRSRSQIEILYVDFFLFA